MAPDFPSFNLPPGGPSNVANQKRGGQGGRMLRKRRPDGTWEDEEVAEEGPDAELASDSFRGKRGEAGGLDDFMAGELPWAAEDAAAEAAEREAIEALAAEAARDEAARAEAEAASAEAEAARARQEAPRSPTGQLPSLGGGLPPRPGTGKLAPLGTPRGLPTPPGAEQRPSSLPPSGGQRSGGTGSLPPLGGARPGGTGSLPSPGTAATPRRGSGPLPPIDAAQPAAGSRFLPGSWEYRVLDAVTGRPVPAVAELSFTEARTVPVRRRQGADEAGWIRGHGLPPGRYQVTLQAAGYYPITEVRFLRNDAPDRGVMRMQPF